MRRLTLAFLTLFGASAARAQDRPGQLQVPIVPSAPAIDRVAARGDSVFFWAEYAADSTAYAFDRRRARFARVRVPRGREHDLRPRALNARNVQSLPLTDSLALEMIRFEDGMHTSVVRTAGGRTIALRGPRVAAERRWRVRSRLPAQPSGQEGEEWDPYGPNPTDWAPVDPLAVAVDSHAVWIGLTHQRVVYLGFALGGLLRVDRRTRMVTVVEDPALLHASVTQIEPVPGGYLLVADGEVLRFDPRTMRVARPPLVAGAEEIVPAGDTLFVAAGSRILVVDRRSGRAATRGFRLTVAGDSLVYEIADSTESPGWDFLAAAGVADELRIRRVGDWMRAAVGVVRPVALEYSFPGDRTTEVFAIDSLPGESDVPQERYEGPNALFVDGLDQPALRPFLREALRGGHTWVNLAVARILLVAADSAAAAGLRLALDGTEFPHNAEIAATLGLLGDSAGHRWVRVALRDTLRPGAPGDTSRTIHHFVFDAAERLRDPANVPRLLELAGDPRHDYYATRALLAYRSLDVSRRLLARLVRAGSPEALGVFMSDVASDSTGLATDPVVRDSVRAAARRLLLGSGVQYRGYATRVLVRYGDVADLPHLIAALTLEEHAYASAVAALVELTGAGVEAMPPGHGTPASRAAAQRWWTDWYARNRASYRRASPEVAHAALIAMLGKLNR